MVHQCCGLLKFYELGGFYLARVDKTNKQQEVKERVCGLSGGAVHRRVPSSVNFS